MTMYVCPMHPEVRQDKPGMCPECGMDLVPESALRQAQGKKQKHGVIDYWPLIAIFVGLVVFASFFDDWMRMFMGGFFIVFAGFKLVDVKGFADGFVSYDLIAMRSRAYALAYPFIELVLGVLYLAGWYLAAANVVVIALLGIGAIGVAKKMMAKEQIQCVCLGTMIKLPLTKVTLFEDLLMVVMAAAMLLLR